MDFVVDRLNDAYQIDVKRFVKFAFNRAKEKYEIRCPCVKSGNTYSGTREVVETHLKIYGIMKNYIFWYHHMEKLDEIER